MTPFATRFDAALCLAAQAHQGQVRKGTANGLGLALPYVTHPVAVATLVQRYGGDADQIIAALLHDVLEDGGEHWAEPIATECGAEVLALVRFCTDGVPDAAGHKAPWRERKEAYLAHLAQATGPGLLVSACDKLANLQAIHLDRVECGAVVWSRFSAGLTGARWYYKELVATFAGRVPAALDQALNREWQAVEALAAVDGP
ncbi:MAG: bifunctional (p)ppGpp synthetase/guanosine-3',5'-bis(diphosphate) 3'-pyrophosphohydrolase [Thiocapsa sp.]|uniref:HD domain-containing protein n=1 Tax=Thiocapsa sp. TaxID=2024551 RepID=UPI001BCFB831|nr:HD domain-containing protein [Thiocapsa sp.]QVL49703.1 MAG: bifunctional (p)ppGpp synthetase/guanosine-3',5'-bis(diphosphate) 3'-pyrophosphohydrolase [Thiocapsa sp.]